MSELRDLDIEVELEVDASELITANAQIDALIDNIKRIDDVVKINVKLDILDALQDLTHLQTIIEALESQTIKPKIDIDIATATAKLALLQSQINNMSGEHIPIIITSNGNGNNGPPQDQHIELHLDTSAAMQKIEALRAQLNALDNVTKIKIDVDTTEAMANIMALKTLLSTMQTHTIDIDVDMGAAMAQLLALQALLQLLNGGGGGPNPPLPNLGGLLMSNPILAVMGLIVKVFVLIEVLQMLASVAMVAVGAIGTLGVALGLLGSGALAVGGAFAVAFAGIGGAAAFVIPSIKALYDENTKLNALQKETKTHIDSLKNAWGRFVDANQATALDLTTHGVNVLKTALTQLSPIMTAGANAIDILFHNLDAALQGEQMTTFFDSMKRQIPQMTEWIGNGIGNIARGAANLMTAFEPLTMWVGEGFANMMQRFSNWTFNLQGSEKLTAFIDYVKTNLPTLGSGLGDATTGIVNFFAAFDDTASSGIQWFADTMKEFDTWASNLGSNDGFQKMLSDIETMAPKVADGISAIADSAKILIDKLASGNGLDNFVGVLEGISKTLNGENRVGEFLFGEQKVEAPKNNSAGSLLLKGLGKGAGWLFGDNKGSTLEERINIRADVSSVTSDITNATRGPFDVGAQVNELKPPMLVDPIDVMARATDVQVSEVTNPINVPATVDKVTTPTVLPSLELAGRVQSIAPPPTGALPVAEMTGRVNQIEKPPMLPTMELQAKVNKIEPPPMGAVSLPVKASSVDTSSLPAVRMPLSLSGANPLNNFNWPPLPSFTFPPLPTFTFPPLPVFTWPALPKWNWPAMPKFSWPAYPRFSWPPMPKVTVSVSGGAVPGFSSGLGKVQQDMHAVIHKGEAVLPAHQAELLRNMGVIQGEGRYPDLNTQPLASSSSSYTTTAQPSGGNTTQNTFSVNITVNGGDSPKQTAINVREEFEKFFASLNDTIDLRVEG